MDEKAAARLLTRMAMLGLGSKPADREESAIKSQEWALTLRDVSEREATDAARDLAATPGPRFGVRPGDLLELVYAHRLRAPREPQRVLIMPATTAQVQLAADVAGENPRWSFADGTEAPYHYIARLAVLSGMVPRAEAVTDGGYSCGIVGCVDCSRMPLAPKRREPVAPADSWYEVSR